MQEWQISRDPIEMIRFLGEVANNLPDRGEKYTKWSRKTVRLFVCACHRVLFERYAEKERKLFDYLTTCENSVYSSCLDLVNKEFSDLDENLKKWTHLLAVCMVNRELLFSLATHVTNVAAQGAIPCLSRTTAADILRSVAGNPFVRLDRFPMTDRRTPAQREMRRLAHVIFDERDFSSLPILADAAEDAGYDNPLLLNHLRGRKRCLACANGFDTCALNFSAHCRDGWSEEWCNRDISSSPPLRFRGDWALDWILGHRHYPWS